MNPERLSREEGYYWVRHRGRLIVAEWAEAGWWVCGRDSDLPENEISEIEMIDRPSLWYDVEVVKGQTPGESLEYRVYHVATDHRVATCWDATNAQLVVEALNHWQDMRAGEKGEDGLERPHEQLQPATKEKEHAAG